MKIVRLYAYFARNLGDDLMVDILLRRYPQYKFWVNRSTPSTHIFMKHPNFENHYSVERKYARANHWANVFTFNRDRDFFLRRQHKRLDQKSVCSIYIGGSIFMELPEEATEERIEQEEKKLVSGPLFVIGANFGPYKTQEFRDAFSQFFKKCSGVCFRDQKSVSLFDDLTNIAYAPDVVFNLQKSTSEKVENTVIVSVIDMRSRVSLAKYADIYERAISEFCCVCVNNGKTPLLMSFCDYEGDFRAIQKVWNSLDIEIREKTEKYNYQGCLDEAVALFQKAEFVLATRFHAMILALQMNKPFYSIAYSEKIKWVLDDLKCDAYCDVDNISAFCAETILQKYNKTWDISEYIQAAEHQFDQFEEYMSKIS